MWSPCVVCGYIEVITISAHTKRPPETRQSPAQHRTVGIRELKTRLSSFLRQVRSGNAVIITDRGKPVGQILPMSTSLESKLRKLANSDVASWSGRKLQASIPRVPLEGRKTVAEMLLEDRE